MPAEPTARPSSAATACTVRRRPRSWAPASATPLQGLVAISQTDSISSGLTSPSAPVSASASRSGSIEFESSSVSESTIMSSSSIPIVNGGPVKECSTGRNVQAVADRIARMTLGYDGKLYILAFDHRGSFQKKMFGIEGDPDEEQTETISDAKHLIFEGMLKADEKGLDPEVTGTLVDEQFGGDIPSQAKEKGLLLAMPVEKSGQNEFDFQYGDEFGDHIESSTPTSPRCWSATTPTATRR